MDGAKECGSTVPKNKLVQLSFNGARPGRLVASLSLSSRTEPQKTSSLCHCLDMSQTMARTAATRAVIKVAGIPCPRGREPATSPKFRWVERERERERGTVRCVFLERVRSREEGDEGWRDAGTLITTCKCICYLILLVCRYRCECVWIHESMCRTLDPA